MRHWLVGNGRSLKDTPLDLLKDEITWGMNRIHLRYDSTEWRPSYFFMTDFSSSSPKGYWKECIKAHWNTPKFLWTKFRDGLQPHEADYENLGKPLGEVPNTTWIDKCEKHHYYFAPNSKGMQEWHLPKLCTGYGGMSTMMQLAVLEGASEIYLLGCDLYTSDYSKNHFDPEYAFNKTDRSDFDNANMTKLHEVAKESSPVPIYNATIGGYLEVHERVDMIEVLNG